MTDDLVISGGTVMDPGGHGRGRYDVAIRDGRIAAVGPNLPVGATTTRLDASGRLVLPGLIDLHTHVFAGYHGTDADSACAARGTTTAGDGGSTGANAFDLFRSTVIDRSRTRIRSWLNISSIGLIDIRVGELLNLLYVDGDLAVRTIEANRDVIIGIKIRISEYVAGGTFLPALRIALAAADAARVPLLVHIGETNEPLEHALRLLRPGDVVTHAYSGRRQGILDADGSIAPAVLEARERGVLFDGAHGRRHFGFATIRRAIDQGFLLDTLSTDISTRAAKDPSYHVPTVMSKLLALGAELDDVVPMVTTRPAAVLGLGDGAGTLRVGTVADIAVLDDLAGATTFVDSDGERIAATRRLRPWKTLLAGAVISAADDA